MASETVSIMRARLALILLLGILVLAAPFVYKHRAGIEYRIERRVLGLKHLSTGVLKVGDHLPSVTFASLDGSRGMLAAQPGHIMYLNVFTTWCPDCIDETPALQQLRQVTASQPVDVVGLDQQEDADTINRFIHSYSLTFPIFIDDQNITQQLFGIHYIPVTYIVNSEGVIVGRVIGPQTLPEMKRLVDDALHKRPVGLRG